MRKSLDRHLPLKLFELNFSCLLVEIALSIVHKDHRKDEETRLIHHEFVGFYKETMELVEIRFGNIE
jgi:hypothetical protein